MTTEFPNDQGPVLYERRRRLEEIEHAESQGESFWTDRFDEQVRAKLYHEVDTFLRITAKFDLATIVRARVVRDVGMVQMSDDILAFDARTDVPKGILYRDKKVILTLIEAITTLPDWATQDPFAQIEYKLPQGTNMDAIGTLVKRFTQRVRVILREHRISFDLIEGQIVPIDSLELHKSIVEPVLTLLANRSGFSNVKIAYHKALDEIHQGTPDDAVTDAGTALQEALVVLGCTGNRLGPPCEVWPKRWES